MAIAVGHSSHRTDGDNKVTGKALYTGDLQLPGLIYGKILRSPVAHARITSIDSAKAEHMRGVLAVLTRENCDLSDPFYGSLIKDQPVIAFEKVRYAGDIVAAVAATDENLAEQALSEIRVCYDEIPAVTSVDEALAIGAPLVHENIHRGRLPEYGRGGSYIVHENSNICHHFRYERGDIEKGFKEADSTFEDTFYFPSAHHYPMESNISVASFARDGITIWTGTQGPFALRQEVARLFGFSLGQVRVIVPAVGGGYGGAKGLVPSVIALALSRLAQRPVRVAFSAEENFKSICQPRAKLVIKTGVRRDGSFIARRCHVFLNAGAYVNTTPSVAEKAGYRAHGPYRIPHVLTDSYAVYTNTVPAGSFRGFGGPQVAFAYDSHLEMIAQRMKIDPIDLRLKNMLSKGEEFAAGDTVIDCDLKGALLQITDEIGLGQKEANSLAPGIKRGKGVACAVKDGGGTRKAAHAIVKILNDGSVLVLSGSVEIGQGVQTTLQQIVAEELSLPVEKIHIAQIDTGFTPFDQGTNASSATTVMGAAVLNAAKDARHQLSLAVSSKMDTQISDVKLEGGCIVVAGKAMIFRDAARLCFGETAGEILGRGFSQLPIDKNVPLGSPSPFWEIGFGACEVEVDEKTGSVRLLKYISLTDAGKMIHPLQCQGQDEGAAVFGIGQALFEDLVYDKNGQLLNPNLVDYRLPTFRDVPLNFSTIILEEGGGPGPYGAKGMGEGGILAVAPAICNAVFNATGVRIQEVPIKGERLVKALRTRPRSPLFGMARR
jgi:CO/xanthine dehydrogenase Mo-binding subunit